MMSYFCTWSVQNYMYGCDQPSLDPAELEGADGAMHARACMNLEHILGPNGWARCFYPSARRGLYFLLDDGWDVPDPVDSAWFGSQIPDVNRFPGCPKLPWERMAWLNEQLKEIGWRGLGLWISAQEAPALCSGSANREAQERYWTERLTWSERAGVEYWKVDWGAHDQDWTFRKQLTQWARQCAPHLTIEHAVCQGPVNDENGQIRRELVAQEADLLSASDVIRTYDILQPLSPVQTLDRVAALLKDMKGRKDNGRALINCEDECYLAAALGLCAGVMRHPLHGLRRNDDWDLFFPHMVDDAKRRMDEVTRMVNWQEMMPPFGATEEPVQTDERVLEDFLSFSRGQTWMTTLIGQTLVQRAPARVSRGMALPEVNCDGEPPFVAASCHGACAAVALLPRTRENRFMPLADLTIYLPHPISHLAVFGPCRSLRIIGTGVRQVEARDLLGGEAVPLSHCDNELTISGELIRSIGLSGATPGDRSEPGVQITFLVG